MNFISVINIPVQIIRLLFAFICLVFLLNITGLYNLVGDMSFIPWYAKLIIIVGMGYSIFYTLIGLFYGVKKVVIKDKTIYIHQLLAFKKTYYSVEEITKIKEQDYHDSRWVFKGIEIKFTNGDKYDLLSYNYLNYKSLKTHLISLKK